MCKYLALIVMLCPLFASAQTTESTSAPSYTILHGAQCLTPSQARSWTYIDDKHILVDGGRYKYRIELSARCSALSYTSHVLFRGDPITRQVCGGLTNAVITRDYPCHIAQMAILSKEQYKKELQDATIARKAEKQAKKDAKAMAKSNTP